MSPIPGAKTCDLGASLQRRGPLLLNAALVARPLVVENFVKLAHVERRVEHRPAVAIVYDGRKLGWLPSRPPCPLAQPDPGQQTARGLFFLGNLAALTQLRLGSRRLFNVGFGCTESFLRRRGDRRHGKYCGRIDAVARLALLQKGPRALKSSAPLE